MRSSHMYNRIRFGLSTLFGQPEDAQTRLAPMFRSRPSRSFGRTSPLFSGYTLSPPGRVSGEQRGGAAEIPSRTGAEHGS